MKLRSTLLFAAASLTASALAPVVATTSAFFAASAVHAQAATDINEDTTVTSLSETEYSISEGAALTCNAALTLNDKTINIVELDDADNSNFAWLSTIGSSNNRGINFDGVKLTGQGDFGVAVRFGGANPTFSFDSLNSSSDFKGRLLVLNVYARPVITEIGGDTLANVEYVSGTDAKSEYSTAGWTNASNASYTLKLTSSAKLAGLTGTTGSNSVIAGGSSYVLTLTGGDASYTGYSNSGAFVYNGEFGTSTTAIGLNVTGGNQTLGGTSYLGSVSVGVGTLNLGGTVSLSSTVTIQDEGIVNILKGAVFDLSSLVPTAGSGGNIYSLFSSTGTLKLADTDTKWEELTGETFGDYFSFVGVKNRDVSFKEQGVIFVGEGGAWDLVWNGGASGTWDVGVTKAWTHNGDAALFETNDNVTFSTAGNVVVAVASSGVTAGAVTISAGSVMFTGGKVSVAGGIVVEDGGTLKLEDRGNGYFSGNINQVVVESGGVLDLNGSVGDAGMSGGNSLAITLAGGKLQNTGRDTGLNMIQLPSLTLTADSQIGGTNTVAFIQAGYNAHTMDFGGYTLEKVDSNTVYLVNATLQNGTLKVNEGTIAGYNGKSLTLGGANLAVDSGKTGSITAPLIVAASGTTLSGGGTMNVGTVTVNSGASFTLNEGTTLVAGGALSNAGTLTLSGTTVLSSAVANTGTTLVGSKAIFDLGKLSASSNVYTLINGGTINGWEALKRDNFIFDGVSLGRGTFSLGNAGTVSFQKTAAVTLVWAGTDASAGWDDATSNWKNGDATDHFYSGDNVQFTNAEGVAKTVYVKENLKVGSITISDAYTFTTENDEDYVVSVSGAVAVEEGASLAGDIKIDLGSTGSFEGTLSDGWTGTIALSSSGENFTLSKYGNANSTIELNGFNGYFTEQNNGAISSDLVFNGEVKINNGSSGKTFTISGDVSGNGTLKFSPATSSQKILFAGDVNLPSIYQTGGIIEIAGHTTLTTYGGTNDGGRGGELIIADSGVLTITGRVNSAAGGQGSFQLSNWPGTTTVNVHGVLNVQNAGISNRDGSGTITIHEDGEVNFGSGITLTDHNGTDIPITLNAGGRLNIGAGASGVGIENDEDLVFNLNGGTIGSLSDSWSSDRDLTLSGAVTFDTTKRTFDASGKAGETSQASTITLGGAISGSGSLTVDGVGVLKLTKNAVSTGITISENATLELGFGGEFSQNIGGEGLLVKSGASGLTYSGTFEGGKIAVREGLFAVNATGGNYKSVDVSEDATFKAIQNVSVETIDGSAGSTLSGNDSIQTQISVESGTFAGTVDGVVLGMTGPGTLNLDGMEFANGGIVRVESGTIDNLALADGGTLNLAGAGTSNGDITLSNLTLATGTIYIDKLFEDVSQATITGTLTGGETSSVVTLDFLSYGLQTEYALFTFDDRSEWENLFGTLEDDGSFSGGSLKLEVAGSGGKDVFSWGEGEDANTLYFKDNREAVTYYWRGDSWLPWTGSTAWVTDESSTVADAQFALRMKAVFDQVSTPGDETSILVADVSGAGDIYASEVVVDIGKNGAGENKILRLVDSGTSNLYTVNGISVKSGRLFLQTNRNDFYTGSINIGESGVFSVSSGFMSLTPVELTLQNTLSDIVTKDESTGEESRSSGTILVEDDMLTLTISGDRKDFTGTLDVNAGTVKLVNSTGTENFTIDIAGESLDEEGNALPGATVIATGAAPVGSVSSLTLTKVDGSGTLEINSQDSYADGKFFSLKMGESSTFSGKVQLNALDLALSSNANVGVTENDISVIAPEATIVLNNASLNFFNEANTLSNRIEVAETGGAIRVYGNNAGATIAGVVSGAGTLTVKDGGALIFAGGIDELANLDIASGENVSFTANVGITNNFNRASVGGHDGRSMTIGKDVTFSVGDTMYFGNNEIVNVEDGATVTTETLSNMWGLRFNLGTGTTLNASLAEKTASGYSRSLAFIGEGSGVSTVKIGTLNVNVGGNATENFGDFEGVRVELGEGGLNAGGTLRAKDVVFAGLDGASWSTDAGLSLNGETTTFEVVGETQKISVAGAIVEAIPTATGTEGSADYVAATSSVLKKTGAGTLTLGASNTNVGGTVVEAGTLEYALASTEYAQGIIETKDAEGNTVKTPAGVSVASGATVKFTSTIATGGAISLGETSFSFDGGTLLVGAGTTVNIATGTKLDGDIIFASENRTSSIINFADNYTFAGSSLSLSENANVQVAEGKTLTIGGLNFSGLNAHISGGGELSLVGDVNVTASGKVETAFGVMANSKVTVSDGQMLTVTGIAGTSEASAVLTKDGAGELYFNGTAMQSYTGGISVQAGTLKADGTVSGFSSLVVAGGAEMVANISRTAGETVRVVLADKASVEGNVTLSGNSEEDRLTAEFGSATIDGNLTLGNVEMDFSGTLDVSGKLTWNDGNKITLSDAFRKSVTGAKTLIDFVESEGVAGVDLSAVFTDTEKYGRRELVLDYNEDNTSIDIVSTGTLIWNANVDTWANGVDDQWTFGDTTSEFQTNDYVEFLDAGDVAIEGTINTSGVVFNLEEEGATFTVTANANEDDLAVLADAVNDDGSLANSAGLTVLAGDITFGEHVVNAMTSGLYIYGGSLTLTSANQFGAEGNEIVIGDADMGAAKLALGFTTAIDNQVYIGNGHAQIEVVGNATVTVNKAIARDYAEVENEDGTTTQLPVAATGLTKLGAGTLEIQRGSDLNTLTVAAGEVILKGNDNGIKNATVAAATLDVEEGGAKFDSVALRGGTMTVADGDGTFEVPTLTASGTARLTGKLVVNDTTTLTVADGGTLNFLLGDISGEGTLTKAGAGNLSLAEDFAISTNVEHTEGTITFTNGGSITGAYTITENSKVTLAVKDGKADLSGGISGRAAALNATGNVVVSAGNVDLAGLSLNKADFAIGGNVDAPQTLEADIVVLEASTLKFAGESTGTIGAIVLNGTQTNKISITESDTVAVSNDQGLSVLQGTGTLEITGGGTLQITSANYDEDASPSIVLSGNSTLDFNVGDGEDTVVSLAKISTGADGGTIAKSGTGTLIIANTVADMPFDGTVSLDAGTTVLYSKLNGATLNVASTLRFFGLIDAEAKTIIPAAASELAGEITGTGTIEVGGALIADSSLSGFTGTLAAGTTDEEVPGGVIYARAALADFGGKILVQNSGQLVADGGDVTLNANVVDLSGKGTFAGTDASSSLTVGSVTATSETAELTLSGVGTLGDVDFTDATTNSITVEGGWSLNGKSEGLSRIIVSGEADVADKEALGDATVTLSGSGDGEESPALLFSAEGTYGNAIELNADSSQRIVATGKKVTLEGPISKDSDDSTVTFVATKKAELSVDDSIFDLVGATLSADAESTIAVNINADNKLGSTKLDGAGTIAFNVTADKKLTLDGSDVGTIGSISVSGAGTAEFAEDFGVAIAEGGEGTLEVSGNATINGTDLSEFTLTGTGTTTTKGGELAAIDTANVSLVSGTLSVAGDISGSSLSFTAGASLATTGDAVNVSKTTISGDVTLDVDAGTATYDATNELSATSLTLDANSSEASGTLQAGYDGALTKKGAGTWTVTYYKLNDALTVEAGKLIWQNAKLGTSAITIDTGATLQVNGLAEGNTLTGEIGGQGTLEIKGADLELNATAAANSSWELLVAEDSTVTINKALPGDLSVSGTDAVAKLAYSGEFSSKLDVRNGGTLETSMDVSIVGEGHKIDAGTVTVASGTLTQKTSKVEWLGSSTLDIADGATFAMDLSENAKVNSKLSGAGTFALESDSAVEVALGGNVAGFGGDVEIGENVTAILSGSLFDNAEDVTVAGALRVTSAKGGTLKSLSGNGTVVLAADGDDIRKAEFKVNGLDGFDGTTSVTSGALVIEASKLASLSPDKVKIGGEKVADYRETDNGQGMLSGAFLKLTNSGSATEISSVNDMLNDKAGVIFDGAFKSSNTLKGGLFVTDTNASLALAKGANVDGNLFIASESTVAMNVPGSTTSAPAVMANTATSGTTIDGDLTFNGRVKYTVGADTKKGTTLIDVLGKAVFRTNRTADKAHLYLDLANYQGSIEGLRLVSGYDAAIAKTINDYLTVEDSNGTTYQIQVLANGTVAVFGGVGDYTAPKGLTGLYNLLANSGSTLGMELNSLGDAAAKTEMLIGLSPISFGSLLEMQSGFASLENDLLRERLEQRRYERTNEFDSTVSFKPFVNVVGSSREGDGNGTESSNYDISHTGIVGGFDFALSKTSMLGFSLGLDWAEADVRGGGKHEADMSRLGVYGMTLFENNYLGYGLSFGGTSLNTERRVDGKTLTGDTNGNDFNASITFGSGWTVGDKYKMDIAPYVGLDLGYARTDSFEEKGASDVALAVDSMERWSLRGKIGAAVSWKATARLRLAVDAAFSHEFLDSEADIDAAFASGELKGSKFSSKAYMMDENTFQIGPRLDYRINGTWSASAAYTYETDLDDTTTHSANIGVRARF